MATTTHPPGQKDPSGLPHGGTWHGGSFLKKGGSGWLHYWIQTEPRTQKIVDRMVIKDVFTNDSVQEPDTYAGIYDVLVGRGMDFGVGGGGRGGGRERFCQEAYVQGMLTANAAGEEEEVTNTVGLRGYRKGGANVPGYRHHWRLYMDFLHMGDLLNLMQNHKMLGGYDQPLPEAFIWWVFENLANALLQMEKRTRARPGARVEGDEVVVMVDMKPANMLLAPTRGERYPVYPGVLVTDFGSAHITHRTETANTGGRLRQICTVGFYAPEMSRYYQSDQPPERGVEYALNSWTNIWQVGRTIEGLMRQKAVVEDDDWRRSIAESKIKSQPPVNDKFPTFRYSDALGEIVWRCQQYYPRNRPTPEQLMAYIREHAPRHNSGMDEWGTEKWINEQEHARQDMMDVDEATKEASIIARGAARKLIFLNDYPDVDLAERYEDLDMDLPAGCELAYRGRVDFEQGLWSIHVGDEYKAIAEIQYRI